jgi:hypothetical protein
MAMVSPIHYGMSPLSVHTPSEASVEVEDVEDIEEVEEDDAPELDPLIDMDMNANDPQSRFDIYMPAVQALVNALGGYEKVEVVPGSGLYETVYRPGDSVRLVLKDLKKLWRKDDTDDERTVARCMAKSGLMGELVALVVECADRGEWGRKVSLVACECSLLALTG